MDLNYLYHREQVSLLRADHASSPRAREAHRCLADGYAARIADERRLRGILEIAYGVKPR